MRGLAGKPGVLAMHLHPTLSHILSSPQLFLSVPACVSLPHTPLCLVFKSIHHLSEWDLPPERVNNVWQRNREAYRVKNSLASISILSVSDGTRECQSGGWRDSLPQLTASPPESSRTQCLSFFFFFLLYYILFPTTGTCFSEYSLKKSCQLSYVFKYLPLPLKSSKLQIMSLQRPRLTLQFTEMTLRLSWACVNL